MADGPSSPRLVQPIGILLVDDNPLDARATFRAAERLQLGGSISLVSDGEAALAHLRTGVAANNPTDLVLLDLNLPGKDGRDVLCEIRADPDLGPTPVVVLTSSYDEADVLGAYRLGANAYIPKPSTLDDWVRVVSIINDFWLSVALLPSR